MWRLKKQIENTCIYVRKNIEFCGMRCSVREMWMNGEIVTCGYVGVDTRVSRLIYCCCCWHQVFNFLLKLVFRSQSAMCSIYIQMSSEQWEFDVNGEMYHEKAINFLAELFTNWKNQTCQHDVTITLFSRVFYEAKSMDEFPPATNECIKQDHKNRFFEDFYRVVYQNERYEDWMFSLVKLKRLIKEYRDYILHYHERQQTQPVPKCYLSNAAEGNFLETLNLSSSVFERHFIDRPFDRTGMMSVVITGGRGVFEVSRDLSKTTKERVIDNGIGSDLVCLGEQPLHQVPLFKYAGTETYSVPHWINLSFYKSSEIVRFCNSKFIPRIKIKFKNDNDTRLDPEGILPGYDPLQNTLEDSDEILIKPKNPDSLKRAPSRITPISEITQNNSIKINQVKSDDQDDDSSLELDSDPETTTTSSSSQQLSNMHSNRKKINPFSPSTIRTRMSFDRRRWAHLFPLKPDGTPIFPNWITVKSVNLTNPEENDVSLDERLIPPKTFTNGKSEDFKKYVLNNTQLQKRRPTGSVSSLQNPNTSNTDKSVNKLVTAGNRMHEMDLTGGDESIATMITGVAWKSLTIPACLPLTTDYCPSQKSWENNFVRIGDYSLILDEIREQHNYINTSGKNITMKNVVPELVGHRLAMGFQLVKLKPSHKTNATIAFSHLIKDKFKLSLGRMYHELFYIVDEQTGSDYVKVEISVPEKDVKVSVEELKEQKYVYRFQVPDSKVYHVSYCDLSRKDIKLVKWNNIDRYICIQGNGSISPLELQNCWRQRLYLLPLSSISIGNNTNPVLAAVALSQAVNASNSSFLASSLSSLSSSSSSSSVESSVHFDVYQRKTIDELKQYRENYFMRFMEYLNKVQRTTDTRITQSSIAQNGVKMLPSPKEKLEFLLIEYQQMPKNDKLTKVKSDEITTYLEATYKAAMLENIPFLLSKNDIPPNCFISAEATWWCIQNIKDIDVESQANIFLQTMLDFNIIEHISKVEKTYIHGFYLYYILTNESCKIKFDYTKDYCEVGLCEFDCGTILNEKNLFFSKTLPKQSKLLPVSGTNYSYSQYGLNSTLESPILKIVNVDVDPMHKSTRVEWASAIYRSYHHPLAAFELELYWKMATGQLLAELVNNWLKMSSKFNYHVVPGPIDPFTSPIDPFADPLRGCIFIKLSLKSLLQDEKILFENYIEKKYFKYDNQKLLLDSNDLLYKNDGEFREFLHLKYKDDVLVQKLLDKQQLIEQDFQEFIERERTLRLQYYQEAILERFGFVRNAAITKQHNSDDDATFFIHSSGGMFVLIPNYYATYTGRSRHASQNIVKRSDQQLLQQQQSRKLQQALDSVDSTLNSNDSPISRDELQQQQQQTMSISLNQNKLLNKIYENSRCFESETKSFNFIDCEENKDDLLEKLAYSHDSLMNASTSELKFLENHVNFNNKISSINYYPNQATSAASSSNNTATTGPLNTNIQRARSNTRSQFQFYEMNKGAINNTTNSEQIISPSQLNSSSFSSTSSQFQFIKQQETEMNFFDSVDSVNKLSSSDMNIQLLANNDCSMQTNQQYPQQIQLDNNYMIKKKQPFYLDNDLFIGFLWSWNFMLGKRWRSQYTGDEQFQDSVLADFRAFCSNKDDRLVKFYNDSKP